MKRFLGFLSLTTATQFCLLINQLVLLPLQLRVWGHEATAQWFVVIAVANLATVADLGLRNAGHAQLLRSTQEDGEQAAQAFKQTWALARALFVGLTAALLANQALTAMRSGHRLDPWICAVTISLALDTVIIVRGIWFDTLGHFNKVEAIFLGLVAGRILLSIIALLGFKAQPPVLGWIMLGTALATAAAQAQMLRSPKLLAFFAPGFRDLHWRDLGVVRFVVAEPAANWVRGSLPVIVLAAIASPFYVTTYVALRAIFSLARQVINQIARYASVDYVQRSDSDLPAAENFAIRCVLLSATVAVGVSSVTIADRGRLLGVWLNGADPHVVSAIAISFAVGATAYGYQVVTGVMMRSGEVVGVAKRQYAYLIASAVAAIIARLANSPILYLVLLASAELLIAGLFITALSRRVARACVAAFGVAGVVLGVLWLVAQADLGGLFFVSAPVPIMASLTLAGVATVLMILQCLAIDGLFERIPIAALLRKR